MSTLGPTAIYKKLYEGSGVARGGREGRLSPPDFHQKSYLFQNFMQCLTFDPDTSNSEF